MTDVATLPALAAELERELLADILPYWMDRTVDERHGGFVGYVGDDERADPDAPRGSILGARILWTFAAAYAATGNPRHRAMADRAATELRTRFVDPVYGGVYWMIEADGAPRDTRKHVYAQAFAIYALAEHYRATGDRASLDVATATFELVERHARDAIHGGYEEAFSREWVLLDDVRLSAQDANERKSMNTHLHLLEAYTTLHRASPDARVAARLRELIALFLDRIVDPATARVTLFFDAAWTPRSTQASYGHDIETSWLLVEAAEETGDSTLRRRAAALAVRMADAVLADGYDAEHGGLYNDGGPDGVHDTDKEWWPQAEAIVGFVNAHQLTGDGRYLDAAAMTWRFVRRHVIDARHGEWHRRVARDGRLRPGHEKVGPWKCCYHNGRACLEVAARASLAAPSPVSAR